MYNVHRRLYKYKSKRQFIGILNTNIVWYRQGLLGCWSWTDDRSDEYGDIGRRPILQHNFALNRRPIDVSHVLPSRCAASQISSTASGSGTRVHLEAVVKAVRALGSIVDRHQQEFVEKYYRMEIQADVTLLNIRWYHYNYYPFVYKYNSILRERLFLDNLYNCRIPLFVIVVVIVFQPPIFLVTIYSMRVLRVPVQVNGINCPLRLSLIQNYLNWTRLF